MQLKRKLFSAEAESEDERNRNAQILAFWGACRSLQFDQVKYMLDTSVIPSTTVHTRGKSKTIFHHAFLYHRDHRAMLELLLRYTREQLDPLIIYSLCWNWREDMTDSMKLLLQRQQFELEPPGAHRNALHMLPGDANNEIISALVAAGANINYQDIKGETPLFRAVGLADSSPLVCALLMSGARTDIPNSKGWPPHFRPAAVSHLQDLLTYGADLNRRGPGNFTALHAAVLESPLLDQVHVLLEAGADPDARTWEGDTVLTLCPRSSDLVPLLSLMLLYGANPHARNLRRITPYEVAIRQFILEFQEVDDFRQATNTALDLLSLFIAYGVTEADLATMHGDIWQLFQQIMSDALVPKGQTLYRLARRNAQMKLP